MGRLRILTAGIEPAVLEIPADVVTLGRREDNALCVPHASVSGRHCELGESADTLTILDLGSTNGTFIKGQRIEQGTVTAGETFHLGGVEVRYEVGAPAAAAEPPRAAPTPAAPTAAAASAPAPAPAHGLAPVPAVSPAVSPSAAPVVAAVAEESATVNLPPPALAPTAEKPKSVFPPTPQQPKPGAPLLPKPAMPRPAMPNPAGSGEATPAVQKAAAPLAAASTPAVKAPAQPLAGGMPKVITPPSEPPKFSLGHHAKPHAAPAASPKPQAAATPAPEHGAPAAPATPTPSKPAAPLGGVMQKVITPPSAPPKFSLGHHAKPHAAPPASPVAATAPAVAPASPTGPAIEAEPIAELPAEATTENATENTTETATEAAPETTTETAAESVSETPSEVAADAAPDAPTPVAATAAPPSAAAQPAPAKDEKRCARHPANVAQFICPKCRAYACDTCGSLSSTGGKLKVFCPVCGAKAQPLAEFQQAHAARQAREDLGFQQQVKGVFKYPFGKGGLALLIIGSLMFFVLNILVTLGWTFRLVAVFSAGYLCAYLQKILFATAQGEDEVPGWPDFTNWKDDIVMPFRLAIAAAVASFGPAFGYLIFHAVNDSEMRLPVLFPLFALGLLYFPMALLAVAMSNNLLAVNPLVVMPAIARLNLQYVLACVVFFGMVLVRFVSESLLHVLLPIPVLPGLISSFIALYFLCVEMRLLGLLYFTNKKRLGWFST